MTSFAFRLDKRIIHVLGCRHIRNVNAIDKYGSPVWRVVDYNPSALAIQLNMSDTCDTCNVYRHLYVKTGE